MKLPSGNKPFSLVVAVFLTSIGCFGGPPADQPELAYVEGTVTMDGKPLGNVTVAFLPTQGRGSAGTTDSNGRYELVYVRDTKGAKLGEHKVIISTPRPPDSFEGGQRVAQPFKETVPAKYNTRTTLSARVEESENTIDFPLTSKDS